MMHSHCFSFQSTLPARGATCLVFRCVVTTTYFNPRSPRGERLTQAAFGAESLSHFNPRSPRGERRSAILSPFASPRFQSTLPARGATSVDDSGKPTAWISIHAPREGSDLQNIKRRASRRNFNPRSPRGERPITLSDGSGESRFQSTLPARGATADTALPASPRNYFNPRSPRGERRLGGETVRIRRTNFNPRSPRGERPAQNGEKCVG